MRPVPWNAVEEYRLSQPGNGMNSQFGDPHGVFRVPHNGRSFVVVATDGDAAAAGLPIEYAWEHVSVSLRDRTPTWAEMCFIKDLFWRPDETVVQFHVPKSDHRNFHPHCLHLWRPVHGEFPRPPNNTVA